MPIADIVTRRPCPALRPYVERYVGYRLEGFPPGVHRGLPSRLLTFIIRLDQPAAFVAGLRTSPTLLPHDGRHCGVAVDLTIRGARALFTAPSSALTNEVVALDELLRSRRRGIAEQMAECTLWDQRFAVLDQALAEALNVGRELPPQLLHAWELLIHGDGTVRVEALARAVGWGKRHFSELFAREIGLPPRQFRRVLRFERSCERLRSAPRTTMTAVAISAGYFDHAHMLHEWHDLAGCRPEQWLSEELLSVQAEADANELSLAP